MRKTEFAFWTFLLMTGLAGATKFTALVFGAGAGAGEDPARRSCCVRV